MSSILSWARARWSAARAWLPVALLALAAGAALSFAQAPWPPFIALPALFGAMAVALALFLRARTPRRAALVGFAFAYGYFVVGLWWIGAAFDIYADRHGWMKPFAMALLPAYLAVFWALSFGVARWCGSRLRLGDGLQLAALVVILGLAEFVRGGLFTGFPWGMLGYAWLDTPAAQLAAWLGPYGLGIATLASVAPFGLAACAALDRRWRIAGRAALLTAALTLGMNAVGASRLPLAEERAEAMARAAERPMIRLVQPNVPQVEKGRRAFAANHLAILLELTRRPAGRDIAYVLWPEASSPYEAAPDPAYRAQLAAAAPPGARLILGALRREPVDGLWRNSLFVLAPDGAVDHIYDKRHLVPFGEVVPFRETLRMIGITEIASPFEPGETSPYYDLSGDLRFLAIICYEAIFPSLSASNSKLRPDLILHITNDAWFGASAGPWQHLAQARFRAIEQGVPIYRSANTGITSLIDAHGHLVVYMPLDTRGVVDTPMLEALEPTLYARIGEAGWIAILSLFSLAYVGWRYIFCEKPNA